MALEPIGNINWSGIAKRMNNWADYNHEVCSGHVCICDCDRCGYADRAREANAKLHGDPFDEDGGDVFYGNETKDF